MARLNRVKRCRKDQGPCGKCGKEIKRGDAYLWWANRVGMMSLRKKRCADPKCHPRVSEYMTTSAKIATLMDAQEDWTDGVADWNCGEAESVDDLITLRDDIRDRVEEVQNEYQESCDNIRAEFSESATADECEEKANSCENIVSELDNLCFDDFEYEPDPDKDGRANESARTVELAQWRENIVSECEAVNWEW